MKIRLPSVRSGAACLIAAAVGVTAACGTSDNLQTTAAGDGQSTNSVVQGSIERAQVFKSLGEMTQAAQAVAIVRAMDGARRDDVGGLAFRLTPVAVQKVIKGTLPDDTFVRQLDLNPDLKRADIPAEASVVDVPLEPGETYLLFLHPASVIKASPVNQYEVVGVTAGSYIDGAGTGEFTRIRQTGPDQLPATVSLQEVIAAVERG